MIREKLIRFSGGRIYFYAINGFSDLFLHNCKELNITLFDVEKSEDFLRASVKYKEMPSVFEAAKKSGMEIEIKKRSGLPHIYFRYKRRYGIPVGMLIAAILTAVLTSIIWSVDISGNESIPEETIREMLKEAGVDKGRFRESMNCDDAEYYLLNRIEKLSWISVYAAGSRVFVEIREREEQIPSEDKNAYSNIIAAKDGEIVRADIFTGDGKIYPGTAVVKGDLLVSGVVTMREGGVKFVNSDAYIAARTKNAVIAAAPLSFQAQAPAEYKDRYLLYFFGISIPFGKGDKENTFTVNKYFFDSSNVVFPLGVIRENSYFLEEKNIELTEEQAALLAFYDFSKASLELYSYAEILERKISLNYSSQVFVEAEYLCIEDIALEKQFTVEDSDRQMPTE